MENFVLGLLLTVSIMYGASWKIGTEMELPNLSTNVKYCTDYRCYNIEGTPQKYIQDHSVTDEYGLRKFKGDYCIGLGTAYSNRIGDRFYIELDNGTSFTMIVSDIKADQDTDPSNRYCPCVDYDGNLAANVLEFIMDSDSVSDEMYAYGSIHYYDYFDGDIVKMVYLGRSLNVQTGWEYYGISSK